MDTGDKESIFDMAMDIHKKVQERQKFIDANRSKIIEAFMAETGFKPSECVFAEQRVVEGEKVDLTYRWVMRKETQPLVDTVPIIYMITSQDGRAKLDYGFFTDKETAEVMAEYTGNLVATVERRFIGNPL